jgi:dihydropyrimidinase
VDFNIFEGRTVTGAPSHTISQGKVVYANGELFVEEGAGRYIKRAPFASPFTAQKRYNEANTPSAVERG